MSYGSIHAGMFSWNSKEIAELMGYWLKGDVEGQRRLCYAHHLRTGEASIILKNGKTIYKGYYPPKSWKCEKL